MAKPTGGLLAFDARGSLGKVIVYSTWRGRNYVRRHVIPANPRSVDQTSTRSVFSWLQQVWKEAPTDTQTPWTLFAKGQPLTDRNAFGKMNIGNLRGATDLSTFVFSPGAKGGPSALTITVVGAAGTLAVTATAPVPPVGWTLTGVTLAMIADQNPHTGLLFTIQDSLVASPGPYTHTFTGLAAGTYWGAAWPVWLKPDGISVAYGPSITDSDVVT